MIAQESLLHVRFNGRSVDIRLSDLDIGQVSTDQEIKTATAGYLNVPVREFHDYVVDRHETQNMTIRPQAVFG